MSGDAGEALTVNVSVLGPFTFDYALMLLAFAELVLSCW